MYRKIGRFETNYQIDLFCAVCVFILLHFVLLEKITFRFIGPPHFVLPDLFEALRLYVYPLKKISMEIDCEYTSTETERGKYNRNTFVDFRMTYNPVNHIELGLTLSNVFDRHEYVEASFTGLNYQYYSMPLRGREVLFSVKYELH